MKVGNQTTAPTETFRFDENRLVRETRAGSFLGVSELDCQKVFQRSIVMLTSAGYSVDSGVLDASLFGTPQRRRRHFLIAAKNCSFNFVKSFDTLTCEPLTAMDALGDLGSLKDFSLPSRLSPVNDQRVRYLIENEIWDLPDTEHPICHLDGNYTWCGLR